jgi:hypothetical protein
MRNRKQYLFAAIGGLALVGVGTLLSPRRSEAQFSSPVRVMNTSAAPALNSRIDDPGRIPFMESLSNSCSNVTCAYNFQPVPAGHRVVIQHVSGVLSFTSAPSFVGGSLLSTAGGAQLFFNLEAAAPTNQIPFDQQALYFVDAGQSPEFLVNSSATQTGANLTLVGYELDCNAAPCAAIAMH